MELRFWVEFIESRGFRDEWKRLKLEDKDLWAVQAMIGAGPTSAPVVSGTGGLRKLRFAPPRTSGRRKWYRICYVYFQTPAVVLLVVAYAKNEMDDLSEDDKRLFRRMIERQQAAFDRKTG